MHKIGFVMQKGGAGKSTATLALAGALAKKFRVAVIDMDQQQSIVRWSAGVDLPERLDIFTATKGKDLKGLDDAYDYVIVDTAGVLSGEVLPFLDLVLMPVMPSPLDVWSAADTVELLKSRPDLKAAFLVNRAQPNTLLSREIVEVLDGYKVPVLDAHLSAKAGYPKALAKQILPVDEPSVRLECLRFAEAVKKYLEKP